MKYPEHTFVSREEAASLVRLLREGADNTENTRDMAENVPEYAMPKLTEAANAMRSYALTIESRLRRANLPRTTVRAIPFLQSHRACRCGSGMIRDLCCSTPKDNEGSLPCTCANYGDDDGASCRRHDGPSRASMHSRSEGRLSPRVEHMRNVTNSGIPASQAIKAFEGRPGPCCLAAQSDIEHNIRVVLDMLEEEGVPLTYYQATAILTAAKHFGT